MGLVHLTGNYEQDLPALVDSLNGKLDNRNIRNPYIVPDQTGNSGKLLTTDGFVSSWLAGAGYTLFDHYADAGNTTTTETDLYSDTVAASQLANNGEKLQATYAGIFVSSGTATREIRVYFGGTAIFDSGALSISAGADAWTINVLIIRDSSTTVRCSVWSDLTGATTNAFATYTAVSGLTLSNTQILKITGQAGGVGAATNDIVAKLGAVRWLPKA